MQGEDLIEQSAHVFKSYFKLISLIDSLNNKELEEKYYNKLQNLGIDIDLLNEWRRSGKINKNGQFTDWNYAK